MNNFEQYIHLSRYSKYLSEKFRRETWKETLIRYCDYWKGNDLFPYNAIATAIEAKEIAPSMRGLMTAGKALDRDNVAVFNCSYIPVDDLRAFDELIYVLMCGVGAGFSVERQFIASLPVVAEELHPTDSVIVVRDSRIGWATAFRELLALLYSGKIPKWDLSLIRPKGARLKTFGGRSSGPDPLNDLFKFTVELIKGAVGRKLNSIECHDLCCKIAEIVVVGGVRRSALISLSNLTDARMQNAKNGQWYVDNGQRALANNSVAYTEKPDIGIFMKEWLTLYDSKSGERGIFNRVAAKKKAKETGRRDPEHEFGINPCAEIYLRPNGLCNLTEVIVRSYDTEDTLIEKVRLATILGTFQSTLTNFRYLRKIWKKTAEEERLLGVSLSGMMDSPLLNSVTPEAAELLRKLKTVAVDTNKEWAEKLGINQAAAVTCVKPSGTVSQLMNCASGLHPRYSDYYIRTVRADKKDPLSLFMQAEGVPCEDDVTNPSTLVFSFPVKSPEGSKLRKDMTAIEQLEHYKMVYDNWCEHNASITVYVRDSEWLAVADWVYSNFNDIGGISFLPYSDHIYKQAPYQEISEDEYNSIKQPTIHWENFTEEEDNVTGYQELACVGNSCEFSL